MLVGCSAPFVSDIGKGKNKNGEATDSDAPKTISLVDGYNSLYDLTEYVPEYPGKFLETYALSGEHEVVLVYREKKSNVDFSYIARYLDLKTLEIKDKAFVWNAHIEDTESMYGTDDISTLTDADLVTPYMNIISTKPLILYDYVTQVLFRPEEGFADLSMPAEKASGSFVMCKGVLYYVEYSGMISRVTNGGEFENIFNLPDTYDSLYVDNDCTGGRIKLSTYTYKHDDVIMMFDPSTKQYEVFEQPEIYEYPIWVDGDRYITNEYSGEDSDEMDKITIKDRKTSRMKEINVSGLEHDNSYINLKAGCMFSDSVIFALCNYSEGESTVESLYYWNSSMDEWQDWDQPEMKAFELPMVDYDTLSEKAKEIDEKYDVTVQFGENIRKETTDYTFETCENRGKIMQSLELLDEVFGLYPNGFFSSIEDGYVRDIVVELTGKQTAIDSETSIANPAGLTCEEDGLTVVYLDIGTIDLTRGTVVHEFSHVIDDRLFFDGVMDEDVWNSFNPDDFSYFYAYVSEDGSEYTGGNDETYTSYYEGAYVNDYADTYFIDEYAKTMPTEDRARLMEYLLQNDTYIDPVFHSSHLQDKLEYYFTLIRDDLGKDSWPLETTWERKLTEASE